MPQGWVLGIVVLLAAIALQLAVLVVQHGVRDALRRRQGRPSLAQERAEARQRAGDPDLAPLGTRLPGARIGPQRPERRG